MTRLTLEGDQIGEPEDIEGNQIGEPEDISGISFIQFSKDFKFFLQRSKDEVHLVEYESKNILKRWKASNYVDKFYWSEDERFLAAYSDRSVMVWDWKKETVVVELKFHGLITAVCASSNFSHLFITTSDSSVWNFKLTEPFTEIELIWVSGATLIATNTKLNKETYISDSNRYLLQQNGAIDVDLKK